MSTENLRLLPWPGPDGKRAFLATDDPGGFVSRLADELEGTQLANAEQVLSLVRDLEREGSVSLAELRYAVLRLAECLTDALRVAESRGARLPVPPGEVDEDEG